MPDDVERFRAEADSLASRIRRLQTFAVNLLTATSVNQVADVVLEACLAAANAQVASVWRVKTDGAWLLATTHLRALEKDQLLPTEPSNPLAVAIAMGEPVWLEDRAEYAARFPAMEVVTRTMHQNGQDPEAFACLPLKARGRVLGAVVLAFTEPRTFDLAEREFLGLLAMHATTALDHAFQQATIERDRAAQRLLSEASKLLAHSLDLRVTLDRIARMTVPEFAEYCSVDLVTDDGWLDRVAITHVDPAKKDAVESLRRRVPHRPDASLGVSRVLSTCEGEIGTFTDETIEQVARDPAHIEAMRALGLGSYACAPLLVAGRSIGAIVFGSDSRTYDTTDLELAMELGHRAATAIENARLYAAQAATARRLAKLQEATAALSMARTPDEVAAVTVRLGSEAVDADGAALWLRNAEGGLELASSHQIPADYVAAWRTIRAGSAMPGLRVLASMIPMWVETPEDYARLAPEVFETARAANRINAFAALPLVVAGLGAGVVTFSYDGAHRFPEEDRAFLTALSRTCEQSLERALLYVAEAAARQSAERASSAKDEFLAMLGHELRNPLATIVAAIELKRLDDRPDREIEMIDRHVQHLVRLVDDLLDVSRITRGKIQLQRAPVDLQLAVAEAVDAVRPQIDARHHLLDIRVTPVVVDADRIRLTQVLVNLLANAAKYTPPGGAIELGVTIENADARISVRDTGSGIPAPLLERMFEPFVQGDRAVDRTEGGLGLGLAIVKNLVELHGGRVQAFSAGPGRGATFTVWWPRMQVPSRP